MVMIYGQMGKKKKRGKLCSKTALFLSICMQPIYAITVDTHIRTFDLFSFLEQEMVENTGAHQFNQSNQPLTASSPLALYIKNAHNTRWLLSTTVGTDARFVLTDLVRNKKTILAERTLLVTISSEDVSINGTLIPMRLLGSLHIESTDGIVHVNGVAYKGIYAINERENQSSVVIMGNRENSNRMLIAELVGLACDYNKSEQLLRVQGVVNSDGIESKITGESDSIDKEVKSLASFKIRVLLDALKLDQLPAHVVWHLTSENGFMVWGSLNPDKKIRVKSTDIIIDAKNRQLYIHNRKYADDLIYIAPLVGNAALNGTPYHGAFLVSQQKDQVSIINSVDLEEYVYGVLHTESWPGWPLEIHKVCAIACRSYAIAMAVRAHKSKKIYHMTNTNKHQTYSGLHDNKVLRQAVDDTRGVFITYNNQPIIAMYDICCGGIIPAHIANFNFQNAPYLAREYACSHCKICKTYAWEMICPVTDFERLVSKMVKKVKNVKSVTVSKKDKAGLVREVVLKNSGAPLVFSGQKMYSLMKEIKSLCFQTRKEGNKVIIQGRGFGHHLGLCQWGAREMVRKGSDHRRVLQFYYPGTDFMRIT